MDDLPLCPDCGCPLTLADPRTPRGRLMCVCCGEMHKATKEESEAVRRADEEALGGEHE